MTIQLAYETLSTDAARLSLQERARRLINPVERPVAELPHVDDALFAVVLVGLAALAGLQLGDGMSYAAALQPFAALASWLLPGAVA